MVLSDQDRDTQRKVMAILRVLSESSEPLGSTTIARELESHGVRLSERTVRYHLKIADERGFTRPVGRDGRMITPEGVQELNNYAGTSVDPSSAYIKAKMTRVREAALTGTGRILANFREVPALAKPQVESILAQLKAAGIGGVVQVG